MVAQGCLGRGNAVIWGWRVEGARLHGLHKTHQQTYCRERYNLYMEPGLPVPPSLKPASYMPVYAIEWNPARSRARAPGLPTGRWMVAPDPGARAR